MFTRIFKIGRQLRSQTLCSAKLYIVLVLAASMAGSSGCAVMRRHPVVTGVIAGAIVGTTVAIATRQSCPSMINGYPYSGTPVNGKCPDPATYDPGKK